MNLTFFAYLIASIVALWYACLHGLTPVRRIAAGILALVLEFSAGVLLVSPHNAAGYAIGFPATLALGLVMTAPRNRTAAPRPGAAPVLPFPRRPPSDGAPMPIITDPWGALYASMTAAHAGTATEVRTPARRRTDATAPPAVRSVAYHSGRDLIRRRPHRGRTASVTLRRALRCTRR